jgi:hypothetical protein
MLVHYPPQKVVQQLIQRGHPRLRRHRRGPQLALLTGRHLLSPLRRPYLQRSSSCSSSSSTWRVTLSAQSVDVSSCLSRRFPAPRGLRAPAELQAHLPLWVTGSVTAGADMAVVL